MTHWTGTSSNWEKKNYVPASNAWWHQRMVCTLIAHAGVSFEILKFLLLEGVEVDGAPENTQKSWTFFFLSLSLSLLSYAHWWWGWVLILTVHYWGDASARKQNIRIKTIWIYMANTLWCKFTSWIECAKMGAWSNERIWKYKNKRPAAG